MYRRFLNDDDYLGIITAEALAQLTRGEEARFLQAEEAAEMSVVEYLSESYEVERELSRGKYIAPYDRRITYPVGVHIYHEGTICEVTRSLSGCRRPALHAYWEEDLQVADLGGLAAYSQMETYYPGARVVHNGAAYRCLVENGYKFGEIRIPLVEGWSRAATEAWRPVEYGLWSVVEFEGAFYTLLRLEGFDNNLTPLASDCWGAIADYDEEYNDYELSDHEYVVYEGAVFYPETDVNADIPRRGVNLTPHDPRNYNLKKHLVRLALYELTKLVAANNVSVIRLRDYEDSMRWLADAAKLRINPHIPRKIAEDERPVTEWQIATFQTDYDPYKNPWMT